MYCESNRELSTEHIIPFGLGGKLIFPKSSCEVHRQLTSRFEDFILRRYLSALRSHLSLPSRNPQNRPSSYKLTLRQGPHSWKQKVALADHPGVVAFLIFGPPGKVAGYSREPRAWSVKLIKAEIFPDTRGRLARLGADSCEDQVALRGLDLARVVAKIGHGFAVAEMGLGAFEELYVASLITAESVDDWHYWVGGYERDPMAQTTELHQLGMIRRGNDLSVIVHLFAPYCPRYAYEVIVGRMRTTSNIPVHLEIR